MALLIDSSIFVRLERRGQGPEQLDIAAPDELMALASISVSELLVGLHRANLPSRRERRASFIDAVIQRFGILSFDLKAAQVHASLGSELMSKGQMIGAHDPIIAATALAHGYDILTDNLREFERVPGLVVRQPQW